MMSTLPVVLTARGRRAYAARQKYWADPAKERERCLVASRRPVRGPGRYDPADYADEWAELTILGVPASEIIARSDPSQNWFARSVRPLITDAICGTCGEHFNPQLTGSITRCMPNCGRERDYHGRW